MSYARKNGRYSEPELKNILNNANSVLLDQYLLDYQLKILDKQIVRCRCGTPCWQKPCHQVQHCKWCGRPMRLPGWSRDAHRNDVTYGGKGYCMTHYETVNKYGGEEALEAELEEAVRLYWERRDLVRAGLDVKS